LSDIKKGAANLEAEAEAIQNEIMDAGGMELKIQKSKVESLTSQIDNNESQITKIKVQIQSANKKIEKANKSVEDSKKEL